MLKKLKILQLLLDLLTAKLREQSAENSQNSSDSSISQCRFVGNVVIFVSAVMTYGTFGSNFGNGNRQFSGNDKLSERAEQLTSILRTNELKVKFELGLKL